MYKYLTHTAHAFLFLFLSGIVIFTIYLAALGWPVLKYRIVQSWTGLDNPNTLVKVAKFNEDLDPMNMSDDDDQP